jgi:hypothetical protein
MGETPTEHLQLQYIRAALSGITAPGKGHKITKIGFWEDSNGDIKYIKFYDDETELFTLTFSNAGEATEETWNITRS